MAILSSLLFLASFILAVTLGSQTKPWSWGPALILLGISIAVSIPNWWKTRRSPDAAFLWCTILIVLWMIYRALTSPVLELAITDLLLMSGMVGTLIVLRPVLESKTALTIFLWGIAGLTFVSVIIIAIQHFDSSFSLIYANRPATFPSGLFGHYNEGANFLIGSSFILAGAALLGKYTKWTRIIWGLIVIFGLTAVFYTRSKSGILSVGTGLFVIATLVIIYLNKTRTKRLWPAVLGLLLLVIPGVYLIGSAWLKAQQARNYNIGVTEILFDVRLRIWGVALSCISLHPWSGGGSRSFSWESYRFVDIYNYGWESKKLDLAHNELLQVMADYGIPVGVAILGLLFFVMTRAILNVIDYEDKNKETDFQTAGILGGGLAALSGLLIQSSFNFSLHLLPGAMLFGIALAFLSATTSKSNSSRSFLTIIPVSIIGIILSLFTLFYGWKATQAFRAIAPLYLKPSVPITDETKLLSLAKAAKAWPLSQFYGESALILHKKIHPQLATNPTSSDVEETIYNYKMGLSLNPYDISLSVNLANLLGTIGKDEEAISEYARAVRLQGAMERFFHAGSLSATQHVRLGNKQLAQQLTSEAESNLKQAQALFEKAAKDSPYLPRLEEGIRLQESIHLGLATVAIQKGEIENALNLYETAASHGSNLARFRLARLLEQHGSLWWNERKPGEALGAFIEANEYLNAMTAIPEEIKSEDKTNLQSSLTRSIQFLTDAKVEPIARKKVTE